MLQLLFNVRSGGAAQRALQSAGLSSVDTAQCLGWEDCRKGKHVYAITSVAPLITDDDDDGAADGDGGRGFEYVCCWGFLIDCRDVGIRT